MKRWWYCPSDNEVDNTANYLCLTCDYEEMVFGGECVPFPPDKCARCGAEDTEDES